jgi:hypothetical protein
LTKSLSPAIDAVTSPNQPSAPACDGESDLVAALRLLIERKIDAQELPELLCAKPPIPRIELLALPAGL